MKRYIYDKLLTWKSSTSRKPLIIKGARQVGKTYSLKEFAKQEYINFVYCNFEENPKLIDLFKGKLEPKIILEHISILTEQKIQPHETLIIFDEIQECPNALTSLKYFNEHANEYHIIAAGSLLGVKLSSTSGFPVGKVNFMQLYPLNFFEFLDALNKNKLLQYIKDIDNITPLVEPFHQELLSLFKKYMYIGGMPEVVYNYIQNQDLLAIKNIQNEILRAYEFDFAKHAVTNQIMKITDIWNSIPGQLAKENKKFIFSALRASARGKTYDEAIQWLTDAGLIYKSYNIKTPKLPLSAYHERNSFKIFMLDVGLLSAKTNLPASSILEKDNIFSEFNGAFIENYAAQVLMEYQDNLYYWSSNGIAELDFVIEHNLQIIPLEVKSGISKKKKSLRVYDEKYNPRFLLRISPMNLKLDGKTCNLPLYLLPNINKIISNIKV